MASSFASSWPTRLQHGRRRLLGRLLAHRRPPLPPGGRMRLARARSGRASCAVVACPARTELANVQRPRRLSWLTRSTGPGTVLGRPDLPASPLGRRLARHAQRLRQPRHLGRGDLALGAVHRRGAGARRAGFRRPGTVTAVRVGLAGRDAVRPRRGRRTPSRASGGGPRLRRRARALAAAAARAVVAQYAPPPPGEQHRGRHRRDGQPGNARAAADRRRRRSAASSVVLGCSPHRSFGSASLSRSPCPRRAGSVPTTGCTGRLGRAGSGASAPSSGRPRRPSGSRSRARRGAQSP